MFTGIITDIGKVKTVDESSKDLIISVQTRYNIEKINIGASIACNGVCLTVVKKTADELYFQISNETIRCSNFANISLDAPINLEKSLCIGDELSGHIVLGHIDSTTKILDVGREGDSYKFIFEIPSGYTNFIVPKGSITLNGVALTVNDVSPNSFSVNIIPHTWQNTTFQSCKKGDIINLEVDSIARYVNGRIST